MMTQRWSQRAAQRAAQIRGWERTIKDLDRRYGNLDKMERRMLMDRAGYHMDIAKRQMARGGASKTMLQLIIESVKRDLAAADGRPLADQTPPMFTKRLSGIERRG